MTKVLGGLLALTALLTALATTRADEDAKKPKIDIEAFFKKLDSNVDGRLSKAEFLKMAERAKDKDKARDKLGQAFDKLDPDMKGISKERFKKFLEMRRKDVK